MDAWPRLPSAEWRDTAATVHLWTQMVGKARLAQVPRVNHWWNVALRLTARGLTSGATPWNGRTFEMSFDFVAHELQIADSDGAKERIKLRPEPVRDFWQRFIEALGRLEIRPRIWPHPVEVEHAVPFPEDGRLAAYDPEAMERFHQALLSTERVLDVFRARYLGKSSPIHFFWGAFDLALTRFSGRRAPPHPGGAKNLADWVVREAYSHECASAGFWPGSGPIAYPAFYAYAYPEPPRYAAAPMLPSAAFYAPELKEFILPYDEVRRAREPEQMLLAFVQSTYEAAADLGGWSRSELERTSLEPTEPAAPRPSFAEGRRSSSSAT